MNVQVAQVLQQKAEAQKLEAVGGGTKTKTGGGKKPAAELDIFVDELDADAEEKDKDEEAAKEGQNIKEKGYVFQLLRLCYKTS